MMAEPPEAAAPCTVRQDAIRRGYRAFLLLRPFGFLRLGVGGDGGDQGVDQFRDLAPPSYDIIRLLRTLDAIGNDLALKPPLQFRHARRDGRGYWRFRMTTCPLGN